MNREGIRAASVNWPRSEAASATTLGCIRRGSGRHRFDVEEFLIRLVARLLSGDGIPKDEGRTEMCPHQHDPIGFLTCEDAP